MYEKGSPVRVCVEIGPSRIKELQFIGKVLVDAEDFMAIQFDTIILPKMEIKSAEPLPDRPVEEVLGMELSAIDAVNRPRPPKIENVRFIEEKQQKKSK